MNKAIICSFINRCKNYPKKCQDCKWNSNNELGDFLLLETEDGKTIRYLVN